MQFHLDRKVRLSEDSKYESLYAWYLCEVDSDGKTVGSDQVPWEWSSYFTATELRYQASIETNSDKASPRLVEDEHIWCTLRPTPISRGNWKSAINYSMFGTKRSINDFGLIIRKARNEAGERCSLWGSAGYTDDADFRDHATDDVLHITLHVTDEQFGRIAKMIRAEEIDSLQLRLQGVSGFYSEWSPDAITHDVKVLTRGSEHEVLKQVGCSIDPPRLGDVAEFSLYLEKRRVTESQQDESEQVENDDTEEAESAVEDPVRELNAPPVLLSQLVDNYRAIRQLQLPLWIAVVLLGLVLVNII